MSCSMAHWPSVVLILLPTPYKGKILASQHFSGSRLGKSTQITILHDATQVNYTGESQNTKYAWFLDGERVFLARL